MFINPNSVFDNGYYTAKEIAEMLCIEVDEVFRFALSVAVTGVLIKDMTYAFCKTGINSAIADIKQNKKSRILEKLLKTITDKEDYLCDGMNLHLAKHMQNKRKNILQELQNIPRDNPLWERHYFWLDTFKGLRAPLYNSIEEDEETLWAFIVYELPSCPNEFCVDLFIKLAKVDFRNIVWLSMASRWLTTLASVETHLLLIEAVDHLKKTYPNFDKKLKQLRSIERNRYPNMALTFLEYITSRAEHFKK